MHLGDILQASDHLSHAINSYEKIVDGRMERTPQKQPLARKGRFCFVELFVCVVSVGTHHDDECCCVYESDSGSVLAE